jgi:hypothetical protein
MWPFSAFPTYNHLFDDRSVVRDSARFCNHTLAVVFGALFRSGIKLKRALTIEGAPYSFLLRSQSDSRRLSPAGTPGRTFSSDRIQDLLPAFSDLKELSLKSFQHHRLFPHDFSPADCTPFTWVANFTPLWQSIRVLSISGAEQEQAPYILGDTLPGSAITTSKELCAAIFPHLQVLTITDAHFRIEDIVQMLRNHSPTLEAFSTLNCVPISSLDYMDLLRALTDLPALRSLELNRGSPVAGLQRYRKRWTLEGIQRVVQMTIKEKTAAAFQNALEVRIAAVLATNKALGG